MSRQQSTNRRFIDGDQSIQPVGLVVCLLIVGVTRWGLFYRVLDPKSITE